MNYLTCKNDTNGVANNGVRVSFVKVDTFDFEPVLGVFFPGFLYHNTPRFVDEAWPARKVILRFTSRYNVHVGIDVCFGVNTIPTILEVHMCYVNLPLKMDVLSRKFPSVTDLTLYCLQTCYNDPNESIIHDELITSLSKFEHLVRITFVTSNIAHTYTLCHGPSNTLTFVNKEYKPTPKSIFD